MPWARLEDGYFTHRKVADLSKDAKLLDLAAIAFSARELRDGDLSRGDVRVVAAQVDVDDPMAVADQLVAAGRWVKQGDRYVIHDYLKYNPSREQVLKEREASAQRVAAWRQKRKSPSPARNGVTDTARTDSPDPDPEPRTRNPDPDPDPEPGDARASREGSECKSDRSNRPRMSRSGASIVMHPPDANGSVRIEQVPFNADLAVRIQTIGQELDDDNIAASITRAQRYQTAARLDDGHMANAIKDARRRTLARLNDLSRAPPSAPMAYFLATLERTTEERAKT